jgi:hypothetical protein
MGRLFCVRWRDTPTLEDVRYLEMQVGRAQQAAGRPLVYLAIIHPEEGPPSAEVRDALFHFFKVMQRYCESMHLVVLGTGFRHTVVRSIVTTGMLLTGLHGFIRVHSTTPEAVHAFSESCQLEPRDLLRFLDRVDFTA